ncbi:MULTISPECIES: ATP-binding protein [unclassified Marinovum]
MTRTVERIATLDTHATQQAVRSMLDQTQKSLVQWRCSAVILARVELVLAEVLNNVVEHGYGCSGGPIHLELRLVAGDVTCIVTDSGAPLPGRTLPQGLPVKLDCAREDLPEGGFGWRLIHQLTNSLDYNRNDGRNQLTLSFQTL